MAGCYIWLVPLYGVEVHILNTVGVMRLEAFEMWLYHVRKVLRILWAVRASGIITCVMVEEFWFVNARNYCSKHVSKIVKLSLR